MATLQQWIGGARPRTLPAAVAPVLVGTAAAAAIGRSDAGLAILALVVSLALQIGVNYANDYSDGIRGTDDVRVGPIRLVGHKIANPENVKLAAFFSFAAAAVAGLALIALSGAWLMLPLGIAAVWAAWHYTGGDEPYGYRGMGEVYVFVFFGLVATLGTLWVQAHTITVYGLLGAIGIGAIASALLVVNNLRDISGDTAAGKRTLAVRIGDPRTRSLYAGLLTISVLCLLGMAAFHPWTLVAVLSLPLAWRGLSVVRSGATGLDLIPPLGATGLYETAYGALVLVGAIITSLL